MAAVATVVAEAEAVAAAVVVAVRLVAEAEAEAVALEAVPATAEDVDPAPDLVIDTESVVALLEDKGKDFGIFEIDFRDF